MFPLPLREYTDLIRGRVYPKKCSVTSRKNGGMGEECARSVQDGVPGYPQPQAFSPSKPKDKKRPPQDPGSKRTWSTLRITSQERDAWRTFDRENERHSKNAGLKAWCCIRIFRRKKKGGKPKVPARWWSGQLGVFCLLAGFVGRGCSCLRHRLRRAQVA